eukprot:c3504_g1_i1.p1 GENE.c3504_g1_i1~~c3504_g1_i1.p1  ORF type:complete len:324 (+),score=77.13 c3504_g1_i1:147-974(+)
MGDESIARLLETVTISRAMSGITSINLSRTKVTDASLPFLSSCCSQLTSVNISGTSITNVGVSNLRLFALKTFEANGTTIGDEGMAAMVHRSPMLETVHLNNTRITDTTLKQIAQHCPNLCSIVANLTQITGTWVSDIASHPLQKLVLSNTKMNDESLEQLTNILSSRRIPCQLQLLVLSGSLVTAKSLVPLLAVVGPTLESLSISNLDIPHSVAVTIAEHCSALQTLDISNNLKITDDSVFKILESCRELRMLGVANTRITDASIIKCVECWYR